MLKTVLHIALTVFLSLSVIACDSNQEKHQKTLEEQLVENFKFSDRAVRARVDTIVAASKDKNYALAMNELALLSATQLNDQQQSYAIKRLMDQLRFNMEEEEMAARN